MGVEPHVDAVEVEAMAALGQDLDFLALGQLGKTDGALEPTGWLEIFGAIHGDGEGIDDRGLEPAAGGGGGVLVGAEDQAGSREAVAQEQP